MFKQAPDGTAYELTGQKDAPTLVLVHGLGLCRDLWQPYLEEFDARYQVLNYDLYGHGDSAPAPQEASLAVYARQIANLLDHLEIDQAAVIGFSIGGMINRRFAMDYPDRVSALAILNSPHDRGETAQLAVEKRALTVREQGPMATLDEALRRWFTPAFLEAGDGAESVRRWRKRVDAESYAQAAWVLANGVRELIAPKDPIGKPALIMTCENDSGSTPAMSEDICAEIAGSELIIIPEYQHLGLMEQPALFAEPITRFLERHL